MHHSFGDFLRHGANGQYVLARRNDQVYGHCVSISIKSTFPHYAALRADFTDRLDQVIVENTQMLLNALTPPDTVPVVTQDDLRDVTDAKDETLNQWDARLARIFNEYHTHLPRLRPLRTAMEERLLRAFAGLINQLRQEDLGIAQYVWRSRDDAKVRDSHAEYDDRVFGWDDPPEGGHPGQAYNCRCYAEPIDPGTQSDVTPVDFVPTADGGYPLQDLLAHEAKGGHTIARHVGKSEAFLRRSVTVDQIRWFFVSRLRRRHGSFSSLQSAQKLTNPNLARNAAEVNDVATGQLPDAFIKSTFNSVTGTEAFRTRARASAPVVIRQTTGVGTYIQHAPDMPNGFIIITSYPRID